MIKKPMVFKNKDRKFPDKLFPPELYTIYFPSHIIRCVFNLTEEEKNIALERISRNPRLPYMDILNGMPNTIFADEGAILRKQIDG